MHFIQGFFCQMSIRSDLLMNFDMVMFAGQIAHQDNDPESPLVGVMNDDLIGKAVLSEVTISENEIRFLKRYVNGQGMWTDFTPEGDILYVLQKDIENTWVGTYTVPNGSSPTIGPVRCVVSEVKDELFQADLKRFALKQGVDPLLFYDPNEAPPKERPINF